MKKIETSKLLLLAAYTFAGLLTLAVIVGTFLNIDTSNLTIVAGASWAEVAIHTTAYSIKSKAENRLKLLLAMIKELSENDKFEPDIIVQLFEGVTKGE